MTVGGDYLPVRGGLLRYVSLANTFALQCYSYENGVSEIVCCPIILLLVEYLTTCLRVEDNYTVMHLYCLLRFALMIFRWTAIGC